MCNFGCVSTGIPSGHALRNLPNFSCALLSAHLLVITLSHTPLSDLRYHNRSNLWTAMINICYSVIPPYLHNSAFYCSLSSEDETEIQVPADSFKPDDSVANLADFTRLLRVVLFWGLDKLPVQVIRFCSGKALSVWESAAVDVLGANSPTLHNLQTIFNPSATKDPLVVAIELNQEDVAECLLMQCSPHARRLRVFAEAAAQSGSFPLLTSLHTNGFAWGGRCCQFAATNGHLHCLQYLRKHDCPWFNDISVHTALNGQAECLRYILEEQGLLPEVDYVTTVQGGSLDCIQLLHEHGYVWTWQALELTARDGHLKCVQYLYETCGCRWSDRVTLLAVLSNRVEVLRYAHSVGCLYPSDIYRREAASGNPVDPEDQQQDAVLFSAAFETGRVECVQFLLETGFPVRDYKYKSTYNPPVGCKGADFDERFRRCVQLAEQHGWDSSVLYRSPRLISECINGNKKST